MKPSEKYRALMLEPGFMPDASQQRSIILLDELHSRVIDAGSASWWQRVFRRSGLWKPAEGMYFWGGVGRGKTLLMDIFFQSLPDRVAAERTHFHSFMNRIHAALEQVKNTTNPLQQIARDIATNTQVLCLDEFVIIDIGDAMIMAALLDALFDQGVVLVTTSNARPTDLYKDGLQRSRFLPAIDLIEQHCQVVNLDGEQDYRLLYLRQTNLYRVPHNAATENEVRQYLDEHVNPVQVRQPELEINGRMLAHQFCAEDTVWFTFAELCESPRSQNDYLELAQLFNTLILTDIRQLQSADDDVARRFVLLIDVLYDHRVKLICSAAVQPDQLYQGERLAFEFERTASRLLEMQSQDYLGQAHRPAQRPTT